MVQGSSLTTLSLPTDLIKHKGNDDILNNFKVYKSSRAGGATMAASAIAVSIFSNQ